MVGRTLKSTPAQLQACKSYRARNPEKRKQLNDTYYAKNKERIQERRRQRYAQQKLLKASMDEIATAVRNIVLTAPHSKYHYTNAL